MLSFRSSISSSSSFSPLSIYHLIGTPIDKQRVITHTLNFKCFRNNNKLIHFSIESSSYRHHFIIYLFTSSNYSAITSTHLPTTVTILLLLYSFFHFKHSFLVRIAYRPTPPPSPPSSSTSNHSPCHSWLNFWLNEFVTWTRKFYPKNLIALAEITLLLMYAYNGRKKINKKRKILFFPLKTWNSLWFK